MPRSEPDRKARLLANERVKAWFEGIALLSRPRAENQVRGLSRLLDSIGETPDSVVALTKTAAGKEKLGRLLTAYAAAEKKRGRAASYVVKTLSSLKSYLEKAHVKFEDYPEVKVIQGVTIRDERTPTPDELGRILASLPLRWQAAAALMAFAGLRPGTLCVHPNRLDGNGIAPALLLRHLPELDLSGPEPKFIRIPFKIVVPEELSKTSTEYVTFGGEECARIVTRYLAQRIADGERLDPKSPVIALKAGYESNRLRAGSPASRFITTETLTFGIRGGIRKVVPAGVRWRPYVLRAYASTRLLTAESAGKITRDAREAMLGHNLGVSGRYNLGKRLSDAQIDELREQYARSAPFLETNAQRADNATEMYRVLLVATKRYGNDEVNEILAKGPEAVARALTGLIGRARTEKEPAEDPPHAPVERIVPIGEAQRYLDDGWKSVAIGPTHVTVRNE